MSASNLTPEQEIQYGIELGYPLEEPPDGVTPDFKNGDTIAYQLYITAAFCLTLMVAFTFFRLIKIVCLKRKTFILDEIIFVLGLLLSLAFVILTIVGVNDGVFGRHAWDVRLAEVTQRIIMVSLVLEVLGPLAILFVKVSVLVLYFRIFSGLRWMKVTCIVGICLMFGYHVSFAIAFGAMCGPGPNRGHSQVDLLIAFTAEKCVRTNMLVLLMGVGNSFIDIVLLVMPLPVIWGLQMPTRQKVKTSAMFLIGISACVSSLIGLALRVEFYRTHSNQVHISVPLWATAMAEMAAGVIISCGSAAVVVFHKMVDLPMISWLSTSRLLGHSSHSKMTSSGEEITQSKKSQTSSQRMAGSESGWTALDGDTYPLRPLAEPGMAYMASSVPRE